MVLAVAKQRYSRAVLLNFRTARPALCFGIVPESFKHACAESLLVLLRQSLRRFKGFGDRGAATGSGKQVDGSSSISKGVADQLVGYHLIVYTLKIKTGTSVFCLHHKKKGATGSQVVLYPGCEPIYRRLVPLKNVSGLGPALPNSFDRSINENFYGDRIFFHTTKLGSSKQGHAGLLAHKEGAFAAKWLLPGQNRQVDPSCPRRVFHIFARDAGHLARHRCSILYWNSACVYAQSYIMPLQFSSLQQTTFYRNPISGNDLNSKALHATGLGYMALWLNVWEQNTAAIRFYQRWDFEFIDWTIMMRGNDPQKALWMRKWL
jgi:hypothetical protein